MKPPFTPLATLLLAGCAAMPITDDDWRAYHASYRAAEQSGTCHIHQTAMTRKTVPIRYGIPDGDAPRHDIRMSRFPFAGESPLGGCVIEPNAPKTAEVSVCPECVAAEQKWRKSHPSRS